MHETFPITKQIFNLLVGIYNVKFPNKIEEKEKIITYISALHKKVSDYEMNEDVLGIIPLYVFEKYLPKDSFENVCFQISQRLVNHQSILWSLEDLNFSSATSKHTISTRGFRAFIVEAIVSMEYESLTVLLCDILLKRSIGEPISFIEDYKVAVQCLQLSNRLDIKHLSGLIQNVIDAL